MKAVLLLAVLTVFLLLPEEGDAWWVRWRRVKERVKSGWRRFKNRLADKLRSRRDLDNFDLNQDGLLDQEEMKTVVGERDARDLWKLMDGNDAITLEEFERKVRDVGDSEEDE